MRLTHRLIVSAVVAPLLLTGCTDGTPSPPEATPATPKATSSQPKAGPGSQDETPAPDITVKLRTVEKLHVPLDLRQRLQFPVVSGPDPSIEQRINQRLREVPENLLDSWEQTIADSRSPLSQPAHRTLLRSTATIGLRGPRLLSVRYAFAANAAEIGRTVGTPSLSLTVDLATGRELTARDLLSARVRTSEGARSFGRLLARFGPGERLCDQKVTGTRDLRPTDIVSADPKISAMSLFPGPEGVTFQLRLWNLGYPMSCGGQVITVDYADLRGFLSPDLAHR